MKSHLTVVLNERGQRGSCCVTPRLPVYNIFYRHSFTRNPPTAGHNMEEMSTSNAAALMTRFFSVSPRSFSGVKSRLPLAEDAGAGADVDGERPSSGNATRGLCTRAQPESGGKQTRQCWRSEGGAAGSAARAARTATDRRAAAAARGGGR